MDGQPYQTPAEGLGNLSEIAELSIRPRVQTCGTIIGLEQHNEHDIVNDNGDNIYLAVEESNWMYRNIFRSNRSFNITIMDNSRNRVIHLYRRMACDCCCCPCWLQKLTVSFPPEEVIGTVEQTWSIWQPKFSIKDAEGTVVLRIRGPSRPVLFRDVQFKVLNTEGEVVGKISKKWLTVIPLNRTNPSVFRVNFPLVLDVKLKSLVLGAAFLIDSMFFEALTIKYSNAARRDTPQQQT